MRQTVHELAAARVAVKAAFRVNEIDLVRVWHSESDGEIVLNATVRGSVADASRVLRMLPDDRVHVCAVFPSHEHGRFVGGDEL